MMMFLYIIHVSKKWPQCALFMYKDTDLYLKNNKFLYFFQ